jgi:mannose-6-phosphate isomerase-like protein (cupin superfamily)
MRRINVIATLFGIVACLFLFVLPLAPLNAEDTTEQVISHIDEVLKNNPLPAGQKAQMIKIAEDDKITFYVLRAIEGAEVKPHVHKTHDETVYIIKGTAQMFINGKWVDLKPGSLHFNPMGKVHGIRHTGSEPLVAISIFTPAMRETDRHFVQ